MSAEEAGRRYAEARQTQKRITVGRLELSKCCQQGIQDMRKMTEEKIKHIRRVQEQAQKELNSTQQALMLSSDWQTFEEYAQQIRKIHLGGKNVSMLPKFPNQAVKAYFRSLQAAKQRCEAVIGQYMQQIKLDEYTVSNGAERELSFNAITSQSERILEKIRTEPSFDISPIKHKQNLGKSQLPQKDNDLSNKKEIVSNIQQQPKSSRFAVKRQLAQHTIPLVSSLNQSYLNLISSPFPANSPSNTEAPQITPISLRKPTPLHPNSPQPASIQVNSSTHRRGQLSKVKSQGQIGSRGVFQMLQLQQMRFDKLRHGLL